jgi:Ni,Fe-hydrogenase III small subunit/formate hydrogenlyase subunit 6/NADH:ubiquinone oxidoreductase subunit I
MFKILQKTISTGIVTTAYPGKPAVTSGYTRGRPDFNLGAWRDARPAAEICPTGAIRVEDVERTRQVTIDYGRCVFCGQCADTSTDGAIRMTNECELATTDRQELIITARYVLHSDGTYRYLEPAPDGGASKVEAIGRKTRSAIREVLGRSLAIREVDAGSCNGCELEIIALTNPVYDIERFGIHFVASPRHADMLLVTGPVTRNMELALRKTYAATPDPKLVVAVGACGISTGIFGINYAVAGPVDAIVPVDVYIPGCPPRPEALLEGILLAVGRLGTRSAA